MFQPATAASLLQAASSTESAGILQAAQTVLFPGLVILAATASMVIASVTRQENLSGRTRLLTNELRKTANSQNTTLIDRDRLKRLPKQIRVFHERLSDCVRGHINLYRALGLEGLGFGVSFIAALLKEISKSDLVVKLVYLVFAVALCILAIALIFLLRGLWFHLLEYRRSDETIGLEIDDIEQEYKYKIACDLDGFLSEIQASRKPPDPEERRSRLAS